jgi:hypothetical protein
MVGPTGRYLVDQNGKPVLVQGDAAWSMIAAATREEVQQYLANSAAKGFNAIIVNLLEAYFAPDPPRTRYGVEPFTTKGDFSTVNEAYFAHVDWVLRQAGEHGITVLLVPTYLGHPAPHYYGARYGYNRTEGWYDEVLAAGVDKMRDFGRYIGKRYRDIDNLIWTLGGDRNPGKAIEHMRALAAGILENDKRHLLSAHVLPEALPFEQYPDDAWLNINFTYSYQIVHSAVLREYLRRPTNPNFMIESSYEFEHNASTVQIRRQAYWSMLGGAAGQFMGTNRIYDYAPGWQDVLDSPARTAQRHLKTLFSRYKWWELVPDLSRRHEYGPWHDEDPHPIVIAGVGELRGLDFAAAARTPDGRLMMVYMPTQRTITVDLTQIAGKSACAYWFNPETGADTPAGTWPTDRAYEFTPAAPHDWVLVLESGA